jgi:hypothetical protein
MKQTKPDRLTALRRNLNQYAGMQNIVVERQLFYTTIARMDKAMGRGARLSFLRWAFNSPEITSSHDLTLQQQHGVLMWARPHKPDGATKQSPWLYAPQMFSDLELFQTYIMKQIGIEE